VNRRQALEVLRAGPALVTGFPGDAVDIDGLLAHLIGRGFEGGIYLADLEMESLVWVHQGEAQDAWFFDVDGGEAVLAGAGGHDLFREMASNGSMLSVYIGAPPDVAFGQAAGPPSDAPATVFKVPGHTIVTSPLVALPEVQPAVEVSAVEVVPPPESKPADPVVTNAPSLPGVAASGVAPAAAPAATRPIVETKPVVPRPAEAAPTAPAARIAPPAPEPLAKKKPPARPAPEPPAEPLVAALPAVEPAAPVESSTRPWPRTLEGVAERVARHRGQRLAQRFTATLAAAIAPYGGRVEGTRVVAPPMSEAAWRVVVEAACDPIVAVAGRAFVDKTIAAAEREAISVDDAGLTR